MKFFRGIAPLVLMLAGAAAHAQLGVYGLVQGERLGGFTCLAPGGQCASTDGKERPYGGSFGAYYDFRSLGPARLGGDVRGTFLNSNKSAETYTASNDLVRHYSFLAGPKVSFHLPFHVLHPYAEALVGYAKVGTGYTQAQATVGMDVELTSNVDIRAIELGAGEIFGSGSHSLQTIGIGVVFHTSRDR